MHAGDGIDAAVAQLLLEAIEPAQLTIALEAVEHLEAQAQAIERQWHLRLERARYEADRARRHYLEVEPDTGWWRGVWNVTGMRSSSVLDQLERDYAALRPAASSHVSEAERQGIIALVHDLPAVWHAKTTTHAERKHVMRLLIKDVMLTKLAQAVRVDVRWHTHACSTLEVPRPKPAYVVRRTAPEVIERLEQLSRDHTDIGIAECLNQEGYRSGQGGAFTASKVNWLRYAYGLKSGCRSGRPLVPAVSAVMGAIAPGRSRSPQRVGVHDCRLVQGGKLDRVRVAPRGPWWVTLPPEIIAALRKPWRPDTSHGASHRAVCPPSVCPRRGHGRPSDPAPTHGGRRRGASNRVSLGDPSFTQPSAPWATPAVLDAGQPEADDPAVPELGLGAPGRRPISIRGPHRPGHPLPGELLARQVHPGLPAEALHELVDF